MEKDCATHPVHDNNDLRFFMCGQEGFAAIAEDIRKATLSVDLVLWGFDPGMELERSGNAWPRGQTYGDLLTAKGREGGEGASAGLVRGQHCERGSGPQRA